MHAKTMYQDDMIIFQIPSGFEKVSRPLPIAWRMKSGPRSTIYLAIVSKGCPFDRSKSEIMDDILVYFASLQCQDTIQLVHPQTIQTTIGTCYLSGAVHEEEIYRKNYNGIIDCNECGLYFQINDNKEYDIKDYFSFLNSISINKERYLHFEESSQQISTSLVKTKCKNKVKICKRAEEILTELDTTIINPYQFFLDLEHGYFHLAGSRITLFGDENRWAFASEKTGYNNRSNEVQLEINFFGNCLVNLDKAGADGRFICNTKCFLLMGHESVNRICIDGNVEIVSPQAKSVTIRSQPITLEHDRKKYKKLKITLINPDRIDLIGAIRYIDETNGELLRATEDELQTCLPRDLPKVLTIDKWHHPKIELGKVEIKFSEHETFRLIAEVLATLDKDKWQPSKKANNDWRHWPLAGSL